MSTGWTSKDLQLQPDGTYKRVQVQVKEKKKPKYRNRIVIAPDGTKFDSQREYSFFGWLNIAGIQFDMKRKIVLQEETVHDGKKVRAILMFPDFFILSPNREKVIAIVDVKGVISKESEMKFKMLKQRMPSLGLEGVPVHLPTDDKECMALIGEFQKYYDANKVSQ